MANSSFRHLFANSVDGQYSVRNYIANAFARENVNSWATYADAAQSTPVNGTGGSPVTTLTRNTSSPLRMEADFLITKDAANRQGEGVSYDFTLDSADKNKVVSISFDYLASANFVSGTNSDIQVFVYDIVGAVLVPLNRQAILANPGFFNASFQASSNTQYRLIFHIATTNALAWTVQYSSVQVNTISSDASGPIISDWVPFTMNITADITPPSRGTVNAESSYWRRVGDSMEFNWSYRQTSPGSVGSGGYYFNLPTGYTIDYNKASSAGGTSVLFAVGSGATITSTSQLLVAILPGAAGAYPNSIQLFTQGQAGAAIVVGDSFSSLGGTNSQYGFNALVPIQGWTSQVAIANSGILNMASILQNGTRVTAPPAAIGEYRALQKNAASSNGSDATPNTLPTSANGIPLGFFNFATAGSGAFNIGAWEIFIGKNKTWRVLGFSGTGRTGNLAFDFFEEYQNPGQYQVGLNEGYDSNTGILILSVFPISSNNVGGAVAGSLVEGSGSPSQPSTGYFDVVVADNDFQIQLFDQRHEIIAYGPNGNGSTNTEIVKFGGALEIYGSAISYVPSATLGDRFYANEAGFYTCLITTSGNAGNFYAGIIKNHVSQSGNEKFVYGLQYSSTAVNEFVTGFARIWMNPGDWVSGWANATVEISPGDNTARFMISKG